MNFLKESFLDNKIILVTGGAGSLGRRLTEELLKPKYNATAIRILDINENEIARMRIRLTDTRLRWFLGDITDQERMNMAMENVDICIAAAAAKHVDLCEYNPQFSLKINVVGTQTTINAALHANIDKLVYLSSDKAVQPASTYAICKKLSENLILDANNYKGDRRIKCSVLRPPNYIDSDGSVFEIWDYQKEHGLPITVTSDQMTRYFMSFDDIIKFIMKSLSLMEGGEIFVPSGAEKVRIIDLARKFSDNIKIIGMRKGEKLEEMLFDPSEIERAQLIDGVWVIR